MKKKNKKKDSNSMLGIIIAAVIMFMSIGEGAGFFAVLCSVALVIVIIVFLGKKAKTAQGTDKPYKERETTEAYPQPDKEAPKRSYYDSDCMAYNTQHDHDRRTEQLRDFLKSGIIDKEEYNILLSRYSKE